MNPRHALWLIPTLLLGVTPAAEPDSEVARDEKTLKAAGVATDGPALLRFFRERTLTEADRARLANAVRNLGDDDYETREKASAELLRAGRRALPLLRTDKRDSDPERARRMEQILQEIENRADLIQVVVAARVLAERRPEGAAGVLLAYLPEADDELVEEAVFQALLVTAQKDGRSAAALDNALTDRVPLRRAAAAHVLGRIAKGHREAVRQLLEDTDPRVRFEAAAALVRTGDKEAVPALIGLLGTGPLPLGWRAQELLYRIAGDKPPAEALGKPEKRLAVATAWQKWWQEIGSKADLTATKFDDVLQGITIIAEDGKDHTGRVWACRGDGKPLWEFTGVHAWDVRLLPNGRLLLAEDSAQQVTERDLNGKLIWSKKVNGQATTCQRLPSGNTFIATFSEVTEVDPEGAVVSSYPSRDGLIARAHRLRNGNTLIACGGEKIIELDGKLQPVRTLKVPPNGDSWISIEPLPGDRILVAPYGAKKVYELDGANKVLWECAAPCPGSAVRLPNGNTLVACNEVNAIIEFGRAGQEVWKLERGCRVHCARRY
jgi:hypothetical protein